MPVQKPAAQQQMENVRRQEEIKNNNVKGNDTMINIDKAMELLEIATSQNALTDNQLVQIENALEEIFEEKESLTEEEFAAIMSSIINKEEETEMNDYDYDAIVTRGEQPQVRAEVADDKYTVKINRATPQLAATLTSFAVSIGYDELFRYNEKTATIKYQANVLDEIETRILNSVLFNIVLNKQSIVKQAIAPECFLEGNARPKMTELQAAYNTSIGFESKKISSTRNLVTIQDKITQNVFMFDLYTLDGVKRYILAFDITEEKIEQIVKTMQHEMKIQKRQALVEKATQKTTNLAVDGLRILKPLATGIAEGGAKMIDVAAEIGVDSLSTAYKELGKTALNIKSRGIDSETIAAGNMFWGKVLNRSTKNGKINRNNLSC